MRTVSAVALDEWWTKDKLWQVMTRHWWGFAKDCIDDLLCPGWLHLERKLEYTCCSFLRCTQFLASSNPVHMASRIRSTRYSKHTATTITSMQSKKYIKLSIITTISIVYFGHFNTGQLEFKQSRTDSTKWCHRGKTKSSKIVWLCSLYSSTIT